MIRCLIRLLRVPESRRPAVTYEGLELALVDHGTDERPGSDGVVVAPSLVEALIYAQTHPGTKVGIMQRIPAEVTMPGKPPKKGSAGAYLEVVSTESGFTFGTAWVSMLRTDGATFDFRDATDVALAGRMKLDKHAVDLPSVP